ncbi:MAG: SPASM domain-containing protein [Bacteroidales bacterium]|nr:SPASM domain-containing protein [Bacteroidales bacterium]
MEDEGKYLLFNGVSGALMKLDKRIFDKAINFLQEKASIPKPDSNDEDYKLFSSLKKGHFMVPKEIDELLLLKTRYNISRFNDTTHITIMPTLDCNLCCFYCYEVTKKQYISKQIIKGIAEYFDQCASRQKGKELRVDWYGGEPLMAFDIINELSALFQLSCEKHGCRYKSTMATNGTLLNERVFHLLATCNISAYQITLDGNKDIHDKRRPFKASEGSSFEAIMDNIGKIIGSVALYVRINVDTSNQEGVFDLLDLFVSKGWLAKENKFYPYLAPINTFTKTCQDVSDVCCNSTDFIDLSLRFYRQLNKYTQNIKSNRFYLYPGTRRFNCSAVSINSLLIGPSGHIFKCGLTADNEENSVGHIFDQDVDLMNSEMLKWLSFDPFSDEKCLNCKALPVCLGGCPKYRIENNVTMVTKNCQFMKENLEKMIIFHGGKDEC